ncbi:MAG TPA: cupin-like domain-containing protein [Rhodanobacteraceae bacterium]|nr:cupin-like domain-containing protein [Rhodanobacteraceae bacterium]
MDVERIALASREEFESRFEEPRLPVVMLGAIDRWPALGKWSFAWFREKFGERRVRCRGVAGDFRLDEYIDRVPHSTMEAPLPYLRNLNIQPDWRELEADIQPTLEVSQPDWLSSWAMPRNWPRQKNLNQLFFSGRGVRISLHYDDWMTHNVVSNLEGEKEFTLYPPSDGKYLYPHDVDYLVSQIPNVYDVDLAKFPLYAKATPLRVVVGPGETIFVPCGWWHTTLTLSPCISVSSSFVGRHNWHSFADEVVDLRKRNRTPSWKTAILSTYLKIVGRALAAYYTVAATLVDTSLDAAGVLDAVLAAG